MTPAKEASIRDMVQKYRFNSSNISLMGELLDEIDSLRKTVLRVERAMDGIRTKNYIDLIGEPGGV